MILGDLCEGSFNPQRVETHRLKTPPLGLVRGSVLINEIMN